MSTWLVSSAMTITRLTVSDISLGILRVLGPDGERYRVNAPVVGDIGGRALGSVDLRGDGDCR